MMTKVDQGLDFNGALREFEKAWENPRHTHFALPEVHVNPVLREKYNVDKALRLTRDQLWDMELKKAWDPKTYIPYVVSEGRSWGRQRLSTKTEHFLRSSVQLGWITKNRGQVLEEVFIEHGEQRILFMGRPLFIDGAERIMADNFQPLFHVEHAAGGYGDDPVNIWRIVVLTDERDDRYTEPFKEMAKAGWLPGFLEIYIERQFSCKLTRKAL
jgi:hypothetical protein